MNTNNVAKLASNILAALKNAGCIFPMSVSIDGSFSSDCLVAQLKVCFEKLGISYYPREPYSGDMATNFDELTTVCVVDSDEPCYTDNILPYFNWVCHVSPTLKVHVEKGKKSFTHMPVPQHTLRKRFLYIPERRVMYGLVDKVACSYITSCITGLPALEAQASCHTAIPHLKELMSGSSDVFKFTVVRNPYSRLVSAYRNCIGENGPVTDRFVYYRRLLDLPLYKNVTFASFVRAIEETGFIWGMGSEHWLPQVTVACIGTMRYDSIGHYEQLTSYLKNKVEPHLRRAGDEREVIFHDTPVNQSGAGGEYKSYYTKSLQTLARTMYDIDFSLLGYSSDL